MTEETPKTLQERLLAVQTELKAPKGQNNDFGKYKYRSCEDIMEAVKPLLAEQGLVLIISDELVNIGERYYVKSSAHIYGLSDGEKSIEAYGYARESLEKKGMDSAQITGAASSYARKYALNGLFLIDDTKDADTNEQKVASEAKYEDDKPWFNDWKDDEWIKDETRQSLLDMKEDGKSPDEVLKAVKVKYKVSKAAQEAIKELLK